MTRGCAALDISSHGARLDRVFTVIVVPSTEELST